MGLRPAPQASLDISLPTVRSGLVTKECLPKNMYTERRPARPRTCDHWARRNSEVIRVRTGRKGPERWTLLPTLEMHVGSATA
jgi:hypothetical protein